MQNELQKWYKALEEADKRAQAGDEAAKEDAYKIADTIRQLESQAGQPSDVSLTDPLLWGAVSAVPPALKSTGELLRGGEKTPPAPAQPQPKPTSLQGIDIDRQFEGTEGPGGTGRSRQTTYDVRTGEISEAAKKAKRNLEELKKRGIILDADIPQVAGSTRAGVLVTHGGLQELQNPPVPTAAQRFSQAIKNAPSTAAAGVKALPGTAINKAANMPLRATAGGFAGGALAGDTYNYLQLAKEAEERGDMSSAAYYSSMAAASGAGSGAGFLSAAASKAKPKTRAMAIPAAGLSVYNYLQSQRGYPAPGDTSGSVMEKAKGGLAHLAKGKQVKEAFEYGGTQLGKLSDWAQNYINQYLVPTQADRMRGVGGPSFSANQLALPEYKNIAWGSGKPGTATEISGLAKDPRFGGVEGQIFTPLLGEAKMHQSNQIIFNRMVEDFYKHPEKLTPDLRQKINDYIQSGGSITGKTKKTFDPIENFDIADRKMVEDLGKTFENRKIIAQHAFGGKGIDGRKSQIIPYEKILEETTDPTVLGAPTFSVGPRAFRLSGETLDTPRYDLNPAYPYKLLGQDLGVTYTPTPSELALMDFQRKWRQDTGKNMPLKSGALPKPGYYEHTRGYTPAGSSERVYPRQQITEEWIKELQRSGFKTGGLANIK